MRNSSEALKRKEKKVSRYIWPVFLTHIFTDPLSVGLISRDNAQDDLSFTETVKVSSILQEKAAFFSIYF